MYVILGASGGIGSSLARQLAASGAPVLLAGRSEDKLKELGAELDAPAEVLDATRFEDVDRLLKQAAASDDGLSGVACCVGSVLLKPAHLTTEQELDDTLAINLKAAFATVRSAARAIKRGQSGSVVLVSSAAARVGLGSHEAIAAAKGAIEGLTRSAAATYAARGIRVNAVAPGLVRTPASERITSNPRSLEASVAMHPLGRVGEADEVARLIAYLLTDDSSWVTGQVIAIDGGLSSVRSR